MKRAISAACIGVMCCLAVSSCKKEKTGGTTMSDYDANLHKRIKKVIDDDDKRDQLEMLHAQSKLKEIDLFLIFTESGVQMRGKPDMTREEAGILLNEAAEKRAKAFRDIASIRLAMRKIVSEDEWRQIYGEDSASSSPAKKEN
jgi:hypothetical protein